MDVKSLEAELASIQVKAAHFGELATNSSITEGQLAELKSIAERAVTIKAQLIGLKNASTMSAIANSGAGIVTDLGGNVERASAAKGFLTHGSIKRMAASGSAQGIKGLVSAGSQVTPIALDTNPIQLGQAGSLGLLSLIPTKVRSTPAYAYLKQTVATNNAAVVAAGGTKPTSVYTVASEENELAVYAHLSEQIDKFLLEDNDDLEAFLVGQLTSGIFQKVSAGAIAAFAATSGIQTQAFSGTAADSIYLGISDVRALGYNPDLVIINTADYDGIRLAKETGTGAYLGGNPLEGGSTPGIWGLTTFITPDIAAGEALVLDSSKVGVSTDATGVQTAWDAITGFAVNTVRARTEGRFAFDVFAPAAVSKVDVVTP